MCSFCTELKMLCKRSGIQPTRFLSNARVRLFTFPAFPSLLLPASCFAPRCARQRQGKCKHGFVYWERWLGRKSRVKRKEKKEWRNKRNSDNSGGEGNKKEDNDHGGGQAAAESSSRNSSSQKIRIKEKEDLHSYVVCASLCLCRSHWRERRLVVIFVVARESFLTLAWSSGFEPTRESICCKVLVLYNFISLNVAWFSC